MNDHRQLGPVAESSGSNPDTSDNSKVGSRGLPTPEPKQPPAG